jgi:hypothetical protein
MVGSLQELAPASFIVEVKYLNYCLHAYASWNDTITFGYCELLAHFCRRFQRTQVLSCKSSVSFPMWLLQIPSLQRTPPLFRSPRLLLQQIAQTRCRLQPLSEIAVKKPSQRSEQRFSCKWDLERCREYALCAHRHSIVVSAIVLGFWVFFF